MTLKLKCLGAGYEVGRSGFLLMGTNKILLDYGLKLNPKWEAAEEEVNEDGEAIMSSEDVEQPIAVKEYLDAIILSHAHLDHSGSIPSLFKTDTPNLFLTEATLDLSNLLWADTLKIANFDKKEAPFEKGHIFEANKSAFYLDYRNTVEITDNAKLTFYDAGHIIGSAISVVEMDGKKIMYTGDYRFSESQLFAGCDKKLPKVDVLISESTYGSEKHKDRKQIEKAVIKDIEDTLKRGGTAIVASFAIERCQELIALLYNYKIKVPIYVDGMGVKATKIFLDYKDYFKDYNNFRKATDAVKFVTKKDRKKIVDGGKPSVIITTAGMLEGGPIMHYIKELGDNPKNSIILSGYQVEGTNGDRLVKTGKMYIDGEIYQPRAPIKKHSLSGHPGEDELLAIVKIVSPKKVICIHGDPINIINFQKKLKELGIPAIAPKVGETISLDV
jgi:putative mRNA 3-end processing factor